MTLAFKPLEEPVQATLAAFLFFFVGFAAVDAPSFSRRPFSSSFYHVRTYVCVETKSKIEGNSQYLRRKHEGCVWQALGCF